MRLRLSDTQTEKQFQTAILQLARWEGYLCYHTFDARRSVPGFPDCILAKPGQTLLFAELKTQTGRLTRDQAQWLAVLRQTTGIRAELWRPQDWPHVEALLVDGMP